MESNQLELIQKTANNFALVKFSLGQFLSVYSTQDHVLAFCKITEYAAYGMIGRKLTIITNNKRN